MRGIRRLKRYSNEPTLGRRDNLKRMLRRRESAYDERRRGRSHAEFDLEFHRRPRRVDVTRTSGRRVVEQETYWV